MKFTLALTVLLATTVALCAASPARQVDAPVARRAQKQQLVPIGRPDASQDQIQSRQDDAPIARRPFKQQPVVPIGRSTATQNRIQARQQQPQQAPTERLPEQPRRPAQRVAVVESAESVEGSEEEIAVAASGPAPAASHAYPDVHEAGYDFGHTKLEQSVQSQATAGAAEHGIPGGRLQFAISGQQGPNSYRFGYDTGTGLNRVFRFEERDAYGVVHGRYGYYDSTGKHRIVNYSAHPKYGYKAEGDFGPK